MSEDGLLYLRHHPLLKTATNQYDLFGEHMEYNASALHRKLQSKVEALRILRKELEQFRTERDQFKLMAETLQLRYSAIKRNSDLGSSVGCSSLGASGKSSVANLLHDTRERNIKLTTEVEALKQKLSELQGDIELLRAKETTCHHRMDKVQSAEVVKVQETNRKEEAQWKQERANFICHLESLKKKNAQLAFDFKALIDEKEEIITERDAYKCKAHRLNHELFNALKANETHPKFIDIDAILLENKYLHERLKNVENELDLTKQSMNKYKTMLDTKRKKGIIKLGTSSNEESILSHKQVKSILESGIDLPSKTETIQDLKSLCLALLDNLNDKNLALSHQKKTNKILATKIAELEQRVQILAGHDVALSCNSEYAPSQLLLHGYCPSLVDSSNTNETPGTENTTVTETATTTTTNTVLTRKSTCNANGDSGTMSSELDDGSTNKTSHGGNSDDGMSSLSTESGRSILSSEYGIGLDPIGGGAGGPGGGCSLREFANTAMYAYKTPSTTTDSGGGRGDISIKTNSRANSTLIPSSIAKERMNDLKDLPPELAALVQKALHELDMRDFDEVVGVCETVDDEALLEQHLLSVHKAEIHATTELIDDDDDNTIH